MKQTQDMPAFLFKRKMESSQLTQELLGRPIEIDTGQQVFIDSCRGGSVFNKEEHDVLLRLLQQDESIQQYLEHAKPFLNALYSANPIEDIRKDHLKLLTVYILRHPSVIRLKEDNPDLSSKDILTTFFRSFDGNPKSINPHAVQLMVVTQQHGDVEGERGEIHHGLYPTRLFKFNYPTSLNFKYGQIQNNQSIGKRFDVPMEAAIQSDTNGLTIRLDHEDDNRIELYCDDMELQFKMNIQIAVKPYDANDYAESSSGLTLTDILDQDSIQLDPKKNSLSVRSNNLILMHTTSLEGARSMCSDDKRRILWEAVSKEQLNDQLKHSQALLEQTLKTMPALKNLIQSCGYKSLDDLFTRDQYKEQWIACVTNPNQDQDSIRREDRFVVQERLLYFISRCYMERSSQQLTDFISQPNAIQLIKSKISSQRDWQQLCADKLDGNRLIEWEEDRPKSRSEMSLKRQKKANVVAILIGTVICLTLITLTVIPGTVLTAGIASISLLIGTGIATWLNLRKKLINDALRRPSVEQETTIKKFQVNALGVIFSLIAGCITLFAVGFQSLPNTLYLSAQTNLTNLIAQPLIAELTLPIALTAISTISALILAGVIYNKISKQIESNLKKGLTGGLLFIGALLISGLSALTFHTTLMGASTVPTVFASIAIGLTLLATIGLTTIVGSKILYSVYQRSDSSQSATVLESPRSPEPASELSPEPSLSASGPNNQTTEDNPENQPPSLTP